MKILVYSDVHFSSCSSLVRSHGKKFSTRLERCMQSIEWAEKTAEKENCDLIVINGDFFDTSDLSGEVLTAFSETYFSSVIPHIVVVGNHELARGNASTSSCHIFNRIPDCTVIDKPTTYDVDTNTAVLFLPYLLNSSDVKFSEFVTPGKNTICFSHNDVAGIQMGSFISTEGLKLDEIEKNCSLFINGHIHNEGILNTKGTILNIGNLTGLNFNEDAFRYNHNAIIVDTTTASYTKILNPEAFNFYKIDVESDVELECKLKKIRNGVLTVKCPSEYTDKIKSICEESADVFECRVLSIIQSNTESAASLQEIQAVDHLHQFKEYCLNSGVFEKTDYLYKELQEVLK